MGAARVFCLGDESAVSGFVVSIVVDAVDCQSRGVPVAHGPIAECTIVLPLVAHCNATATITVIFGMVSNSTALTHV